MQKEFNKTIKSAALDDVASIVGGLGATIVLAEQENQILRKALNELKSFGYTSQFKIIDDALAEAEKIKNGK